MLRILGQYGKDNCDGYVSRRDLLKVGGSAMAGLSLPGMMQLQKATADEGRYGGPGFGKAKSVIMVYLQGGPSHLELWDPKTDVPENVKSVFGNIGVSLGFKRTMLLPKLGKSFGLGGSS